MDLCGFGIFAGLYRILGLFTGLKVAPHKYRIQKDPTGDPMLQNGTFHELILSCPVAP